MSKRLQWIGFFGTYNLRYQGRNWAQLQPLSGKVEAVIELPDYDECITLHFKTMKQAKDELMDLYMEMFEAEGNYD